MDRRNKVMASDNLPKNFLVSFNVEKRQPREGDKKFKEL